MLRILLLGKNGQLGWELHRALTTLGPVAALDYPQIDLGQPQGLAQVVRSFRPEIIINATAYTAVDQAESEPDKAFAINGRAPGLLAELSAQLGAVLIHFSTDYVFDGKKGGPYIETDQPNPLNIYGMSKLAGETAISQVDCAYIVFRTAWVYSLRRDSFVSKVLTWKSQQPTGSSLRIVSDQVSNPTWARLLAQMTAQILTLAGEDAVSWINERRGLYHLAGSGYASRLEWAQAILRFNQPRDLQAAEVEGSYPLKDTQEIQPALSSDFPSPAQRPLFSALDCQKFSTVFNLQLPDWETGLRLAMDASE